MILAGWENVWNNEEYRTSKMAGIDLVNPFPEMPKDKGELKDAFEKYPIIPFMGDSHHSYHSWVYLLHDLHKYSPTQTAITNSIARASFGGSVLGIDAFDGFGIQDTSEESTRAGELYDFFRSIGKTGDSVADDLECIFRAAQPTGNAYLLADFVEVAGERIVKTRVLNQSEIAKLNLENGEDWYIITNKIGSVSFWERNPPQFAREATDLQDIEADDLGRKRVVFHYKVDKNKNCFYGSPHLLAAAFNLFNEHQQMDALLKESDNRFMTRLLVYFEDTFSAHIADPTERALMAKQTMDAATQRLNAAAKVGGQHGGGIMAGMYSGERPHFQEINPNTDHKWHESIGARNSKVIYSVNGWSPILTGDDIPQGGIGGNIILDTMKTFDLHTVQPTQKAVTGFYMQFVRMAAEWLGNNIEGLDIGIITPYQNQIKMANDAATEPEGN